MHSVLRSVGMGIASALVLAARLSAQVSNGAAPIYSLSTSPNPVTPGGVITVAWAKPSGASQGFIGLYDSDMRDAWSYMDFRYPAPNGDSGTVTFTAPSSAGTYWIGWVDDRFRVKTSFSVALRFVDNGDGTITDNLTGLMWEKKSTCSVENLEDVHCVNNRYGWSISGIKPDGPLFTDFLANLNRADDIWHDLFPIVRKNYSDWRIPTVLELQSIRDSTQPNRLNPIFGPHIPSRYYTSSTGITPDFAVIVDFGNGATLSIGKFTVTVFARAVRGGR